MAQYPLGRYDANIVSTFMQVDSDHSVACPTHRLARLLAARGIAVYAFEVRSSFLLFPILLFAAYQFCCLLHSFVFPRGLRL
jgi:hypothetical protein